MREAEQIKKELIAKFPWLEASSRASRVRRLWVEVADYAKFDEVFNFLVKNLKFEVLCTITGLDDGASLSALYHLGDLAGVVCSLKASVPREQPVLRSVTPVFPNAEIYERELVDLLGFQVDGLREGNRYPLPDGWPKGQFPLRKDWKPENLDAIPPYGNASKEG
jgi:Ni,Fe-hydrogenase III component G